MSSTGDGQLQFLLCSPNLNAHVWMLHWVFNSGIRGLSSKVQNPEKMLGFSKFAVMATKTILAGVRGMHAICVCTMHQAVKLRYFQMKIT
jgi:hypothetical protein